MSLGALQNLLVCRASRDFGNRNHIVARFTQRPDEMTGPAQLSSAKKFMSQDLLETGASGSSTTSSWATLAAP